MTLVTRLNFDRYFADIELIKLQFIAVKQNANHHCKQCMTTRTVFHPPCAWPQCCSYSVLRHRSSLQELASDQTKRQRRSPLRHGAAGNVQPTDDHPCQCPHTDQSATRQKHHPTVPTIYIFIHNYFPTHSVMSVILWAERHNRRLSIPTLQAVNPKDITHLSFIQISMKFSGYRAYNLGTKLLDSEHPRQSCMMMIHAMDSTVM